MRSLLPTNWCFLFYWVFLVNFGPSFHHAELFGLHVHSPGGAPCGVQHSHDRGCCDHGTDESHGQPQGFETSVASFSAADSQCVCCEFFDQYNVFIDSIKLLDNPAFGEQCFSFNEGRPSVGDFVALARGPPSFIALV